VSGFRPCRDYVSCRAGLVTGVALDLDLPVAPDLDLAAVVIAVPAAQQRRELDRPDVAAEAVDQAPDVERL
jgi:hypothetical protein